MDILIQWVTQIIVFLLLAAIIDLLIPETAMKKYIKLVVGLVLILIFLKPVFYMFNIDIKHALESSYAQIVQEETSKKDMESLIKMQKNEIQASQGAYIEEQLTIELTELASEPLSEEYQTEIVNMTFQFTTEDDLTYEGLEEVVVYLQELEHGKGVVSTVDDVVINTEGPVSEEEDQNVEQIKLLLEDIWEVSDKKLTVLWEGGTS